LYDIGKKLGKAWKANLGPVTSSSSSSYLTCDHRSSESFSRGCGSCCTADHGADDEEDDDKDSERETVGKRSSEQELKRTAFERSFAQTCGVKLYYYYKFLQT